MKPAVFAALIFTFPAFGAKFPDLCKEHFTRLGIKDTFSHQPILRAAMSVVLEARRKAKKPVPRMGEDLLDSCVGGNCTFMNFHSLLKVEVELGSKEKPIQEEFARSPEFVRIVETPQGRKYFRAMNSGPLLDQDPSYGSKKPRKTLAASRVNDDLGLDTFAKTVFARINGDLGSLSDEIPGDSLEQKRVRRRLKAADPHSRSEAMSFAFLIGDNDARWRNVIVTPDNKVKLFDADLAFLLGLTHVRGEITEGKSELAFGDELPEKYTQRFVDALRAYTPAKIRKRHEFLLSEDEIEAMVFRREIILADLQLRGAEAIF